jgi:DNA-binding NarL/FixJ family response regulator
MIQSDSHHTEELLIPTVSTVLIVDDHPVVRDALTIRLAREPDLKVCGEAGDVAEALRVLEATNPDVAVIDISLQGGDGIDLIKRIRVRNDSVRLLVWSMYSESLCAERALRAGALGYINKGQATDQIIVAIRRVLQGKVYLSEAMSERLLHRVVGEGTESIADSPVETLSDRELEVFRLIGQGLKNQEMAGQLHLSTKTVETYRDRIRLKLNLRTSVELGRYALLWVLEKG